MGSHITSGMIVETDYLGIRYNICRLDYIVNEDESFEYIFTPDYKIIDILPEEFQGIPGINLDLRKESYHRKNIIPVFISERTPGENREDKWELLEEVGMNYLDPVEWLMRTDRQYFGDNMSMTRLVPKERVVFETIPVQSITLCKRIIKAIGCGNDVVIDGKEVDDSNRGPICHLLRLLIRSEKENRRTKKDTRGRKTIIIDEIGIMDAIEWMRLKLKTSDQLAKELGVSRTTLFRRIKEFKKKEQSI